MTVDIGNRDYLFDNIKAILIFSVVLAHYFRASAIFDTASFGGMIYITSFSYIMQGFLFISGYFSRNPQKCRTNAFKTFLYPYLVLMPLMYLIRYLIFGNAHFDLFLPTMALWYLLTLFFYRYFLMDLIKIKNILLISVLISLTAGFVPFFNSTLSIGRTLSFLPFFLAGYYFKAQWIVKIKKLPRKAALGALLLLICFSVVVSILELVPLDVLLMKNSYHSAGVGNLEGVSIRIAIYIVSAMWIAVFINLVPAKKTFLVTIGQNTMTIYVMHIVVRYLIKDFGFNFGNSAVTYVVLTCFAVLSVWLFSRPVVTRGYNGILNGLYQWTVLKPRSLIRRIL